MYVEVPSALLNVCNIILSILDARNRFQYAIPVRSWSLSELSMSFSLPEELGLLVWKWFSTIIFIFFPGVGENPNLS